MRLITSIFFCVLNISIGLNLKAQGCSDAGFCTAGSMRSGDKTNPEYKNDLRLGFGFGIGEQGVKIGQILTEYNRKVFKNGLFQVKFPFTFTSGALGSANGIGDPSLVYTHSLNTKKAAPLNLSAGFKFPLGKTNTAYTGSLSLPMPYQTGLGTLDFIAGLRSSIKKFSFSAAAQVVLIQGNKNNFLPELDSINAGLYFPSNMLQRGNDLLLRVDRKFEFQKFSIEPGILAIYRILGDKLTNQLGENKIYPGSEGLTLNITINTVFKLSEQSNLLFSVGAPVIVRVSRADGLTRALALSVNYLYTFGKVK